MNHNQKTICVRVLGGLGNQLFIYAFARSYSLKNGFKVIFDMQTGFVNDNYGRTPKLQNYITEFPTASKLDIFQFYLAKLLPGINKSIFRSEIVIEPDSNVFFNMGPYSMSKTKTLFIQGYFQSHRYSVGFEDQIKSDIKFDFKKTPIVQNLGIRINNSTAVAIHVRRIEYSDLLDLEYYLDAIAHVKKNVENPSFFVFSDDINWCKDNFPDPESLSFVTHDMTDEIADLWLMTECKHYIIANSSFSWWGAWLSKNNRKIVLAPSKTNIGVKGDLYPESWMVI